jgi:alanine-glyoxylate transaminase / serine-glyoxylate transaminase / serine-pyruvate transaminase
MEQKPLKLMIPGPIQPDQAVLDAMGGPIIPHYGPYFTQVYNETLDLLRQVFNTAGNVFLLPGAGSTGTDACLGSALSTGEKIIVGSNGFFGDRLLTIADSYGLEIVPIMAEWGQPLKPEDFAEAFTQHPDARACAIVHLETSTTVVNPIAEIAAITKRAGAITIVDAVSSLGGLPFRMDEWGIDLCLSASQKCLGAPPGLSPVAVGPRGWEAIDRNPRKGHGWYSDLRVWKKFATEWWDWHPFPVTMPTSNILALREGLLQLLEEGISQRLERYRKLAILLRNGLRQINLVPFTPDEILAPVLTAAYCPEGVSSGEIVAFMEKERCIKISTGLGALKDKIIRIGHMCPGMSEVDIQEVLDGLAAFKK